VKGNNWIRQQFLYVFNMQNVTAGLNQECVEQTPLQLRWRCFFAEHTYPHIHTPLFVINSMYDSWQLGNVVAPSDDGIDWSGCLNNFPAQCSSAQITEFQQFHSAMLASFVNQGVTAGTNGLYAISCYIHALAISDRYWSAPTVAGKTMRDAFSDWYYNRNVSHKLVDCAYPCNKSC